VTRRVFTSEAERVEAERQAVDDYRRTGVYDPPIPRELESYRATRYAQHPMVGQRRPASSAADGVSA